MKLEHNLLIQGLIELKWMSKEAVPLLSTRMYEAEASTVGKLRAHGLTSEAIFEAAIFANKTAENPLPVIDLSLMKPIQNFDFATFASLEEMLAQFIAPVMQLGDRLIVATADPSNAKFFDILALRSPFKIDYWIAESEAIKAALLAMNVNEESPVRSDVAETKISNPSAQTVVAQSVAEQLGGENNGEKEIAQQFTSLQASRIEPTLSVSEPPQESSISETIVTEEFVDHYQEEETVRYVDEEELADETLVEDPLSVDEHSSLSENLSSDEDPSGRFAALQDSALDVDELESKSQDSEQDLEADEVTIAEDQNNHASSEMALDTLDHEITNTHDTPSHTLEEAKPTLNEVNESQPLKAADDSQSTAIMLREVLDEVGRKVQEVPIEDDVIEYINYILLDAITRKASDIHFEPYESSYRIRFRIDGILHKVYVVPAQYHQTIASRLKVMAELDISEKRLPQDGHITICLGDEKDDEVDARISVIPTLWGEKVVIRLLDRSEMNFSLLKLGLTQNQKHQVQSAIERTQGLVLVTGPTGSGKTVTLYACLNHLNDASKNIATVEDPVEINLEGINQLQVHPKIGLDFAEALRAFLRQDPDVLMVGEIRDYETADITMKAAQTGHLVLSTLHTNSAVESLVRLQNMGVESYNIASTVKLVVAQRLVRELCHCKEEDIVDSGYLETLGFTPQQAASKFYKASGCSECHDGYRGRFAIFEVMPISKRMEQLILEAAPASEIRQQAEREGVKSLRQVGIEKIIEGRTSLEEVLRVTTE
ncbi:Flp pilus assembly complex ATPase component TadA [Ignatzschineria rhizosphaerae]|uniref:Flp pilus assembly complex ATPase component TadA n=1 Tax=Ignatzschineria rhizosphaerae TaxID=2923279 RepID=A0ABY3X2K0_9GAMM|nr:ATPase, T2SS/T4P/T4SS family [Ignatzschineria rhizosphaerae]UNM96485.1 Flp pilus assembly complex ATPase component TadA [Ignatzschineria rhizosphaerae]